MICRSDVTVCPRAPIWRSAFVVAMLCAAPRLCYADDAPATPPTTPAASATSGAAPAPPPPRKNDRADDQHFKVDPIADGAFIAMGAGLGLVDALIFGTGEITPQRPGDPGKLLSIDRGAVSQSFDSNAGLYSNLGLYVAVGFAVFDPIFSGFRDGVDAAIVDAVMYGESAMFALTLTDITKVAVRRPRPIAYQQQALLDSQAGGSGKGPSISETDASLSFFSGHAATVAAIGATATYLAFTRSPRTWRPWVTLAASVLLTSGVGYERVRAGQHFPTDVIVGALAGAGIGTIVPHLHRHESDGKSIWIGLGPSPVGAGLAMQGLF